MKKAFLFCTVLLISILTCSAQTAAPNQTETFPDVVRIEPNQKQGFAYPYYLYVPPQLKNEKMRGKALTFLVSPNNTGKIDDDLSVHDAYAKNWTERDRRWAGTLGVVLLTPVFPRPATDWQIYTHALDRDAMLTEKTDYKRFDLQLIAMIDHARKSLAKENLKLDKKVLLWGFSASGMFVNRFVFLHPTRVKAAAVGSPGGWAIAPVNSWKDKALRYPIGTADFEIVAGKKLDRRNLKKVPMLIYLGDKDTNDSVIFGDSYDEQDKELIFELFGKIPVERWTISEEIYKKELPLAKFKLYPNIGHETNREHRKDWTEFYQQFLK